MTENIFTIKNKYLKFLLFIIELVLVYFISYKLITYFYNDFEIKALHLDDLHNLLEYIKDPDLKSWIIPYHENRMHYRPVFYALLFSFYNHIGTNINMTLPTNFIIFSAYSTIIYVLLRSLKVNRIFSILILILFSFINFNYYEISQLIGFIEGVPMVLSLTILVLSIKNMDADKRLFNIYSILNAILYLLMVFTHERYFPMLLLPIISIALNKIIDNRKKIKYYIIYLMELIFFFVVRFYHLRIWIPRGTDSSSLVKNFDLMRSFEFMYQQLMYLLGINLGPEYLCARKFTDVDDNTKYIIYFSILMLLFIIILYIIKKILNKKHKSYFSYYYSDEAKLFLNPYVDLFFILYILLCIVQSSLTIRVELRWLLSSFMGLMFYLTYMINYLLFNININLKNKSFFYIATVCFILFFISRTYINTYYKKYVNKIFIFTEQYVINSFYDVTVGTYGLDKIKNDMNIVIYRDFFDVLSKEEDYHFFDQFDRKLSKRKIIERKVDDYRLFYALQNENDIILVEGPDLKYKIFEKEK